MKAIIAFLFSLTFLPPPRKLKITTLKYPILPEVVANLILV